MRDYLQPMRDLITKAWNTNYAKCSSATEIVQRIQAILGSCKALYNFITKSKIHNTKN